MSMNKNRLLEWVSTAPKAELHLHIDGSIQPHRVLDLAEKNKINIPYKDEDQIREAYQFENLQSFLDLYYLGASVLKEESDFYLLMKDYLLKCREQNIVHAEIMVEPQTYFPNGVRFETMMSGFEKAISEAKTEWGQSTFLILSFLRHLTEEKAIETLELAEPFREKFVAIGLASSELGNPPEKFKNLYAKAESRGYKLVAHAGEEGPPDYIKKSLDLLHVQRIDHGVRASDDRKLLDELRNKKIPLTVCPLSNIKLCVFEKMKDHNILQLLENQIRVTVNSDDPTYFGGFINENYFALIEELNANEEQIFSLVKNSFYASFLDDKEKQQYIGSVEDHFSNIYASI